jgi:FAD/FMN-containing dehydrogenase
MRRRDFLTSTLAVSALLPARQLFAAQLAQLKKGAAEITARTLGGAETALSANDLDALAARMRGALLLPGRPGYDDACHVWNAMFDDRRPAVIARCSGAADVMAAVGFAREHQLLTAVRGGGHSFSGKSTCNGGIVIDLSMLRTVTVDPMARTAQVDPGALLGQVDHESLVFDLVTTTGTVSHTGVAGLTLGGGFGRLCRRFGLSCDNLRSVDVVTADGRFVSASETQNPDLFWGLRGGGGNFGVATSFEFNLHPMNPVIFGGEIGWPSADLTAALNHYLEFIRTMPDELNLDGYLVVPPGGEPMFTAEACWSGDRAKGEQVLAPFRAFGKPAFDKIGPMKYMALQTGGDESTAAGKRNYAKSGFTRELTPDLVEKFREGFLSAPRDRAIFAFISDVGGAVAKVPETATAFPNRGGRYWLAYMQAWTNPAEDAERMAIVRKAWAPIESYMDGFYTNLAASDVGDARYRANYGPNYDRLVELKTRYDPTNLFRLNANVVPRSS